MRVVKNFNPRAPRGARLLQQFRWVQGRVISIHAPHVGRDLAAIQHAAMIAVFQSTRPTWGATEPPGLLIPPHDISIHAPHVGRDGD